MGLDELDPNRQVQRHHLDFWRVEHLVRPEARVGPGGRRARDSFVHEVDHDGVVQSRHVVLRVFVDEDRNFLRRAFD